MIKGEPVAFPGFYPIVQDNEFVKQNCHLVEQEKLPK